MTVAKRGYVASYINKKAKQNDMYNFLSRTNGLFNVNKQKVTFNYCLKKFEFK